MSDPSAAPRVELVRIWDWRQRNAHLFGSDSALRWHLRKHREEYISSGALLVIGDRHFVDPAVFEAVLRRVAIEDAGRYRPPQVSEQLAVA